MDTLVIISCVKEKIWKKHPGLEAVNAGDAYISRYFSANKRFALATKCDWMILSAKYGFLHPSDMITNYDVTFKVKPYIDDEALLRQVKEKNLQQYSRIIVIGGKAYRDRVQKAFKNTSCKIVFPVTGQVGLDANIKKISELTDQLMANGSIDDICF